MATCRVQTGLRLKENVYEKAKVLAAQEQRSFNNFVEYVIQRYLEDYEAKNGLIQIPAESYTCSR